MVTLAQAVSQPIGFQFWVQISILFIAPILGFSGVAVGVKLKDRADHKAALRTERREAYISFLKALSELHQCFVEKGKVAFTTGTAASIQSYREDMYRIRLELSTAEHAVMLVGSLLTAEATSKLTSLSLEIVAAESLAEKSGYSQFAWNKVILQSLYLSNLFITAAIKDLRLAREDQPRITAQFFAENEQLINKLKEWRPDTCKDATPDAHN